MLVVLALALALVGFLIWASRGYDAAAAPAQPVFDDTIDARPPVADISPITIVTWNIHHAAGPEGEFEYHDADEQRRYLDGMVDVLRELDADVVALQEVDYDCSRSHGLDQLSYLAERAGYPYRAAVTTWRKNWVPFPYWPLSGHIGRMHSGQAVMSRYPITGNTSAALPKPGAPPWWYLAFLYERSIQTVGVDLDGTPLTIVTVHREAFHTDNRSEPATLLVEHMSGVDGPWIVLGDMNALPPEAPRFDGFADEPDWDGSNDPTIATLREALGSEWPGLASYADGASGSVTFPALAPTRRLDYVFASEEVNVVESFVVTDEPHSDHLPVVVRFSAGP